MTCIDIAISPLMTNSYPISSHLILITDLAWLDITDIRDVIRNLLDLAQSDTHE